MEELWKYIKNLFKESESSSPSRPFIHGLIERSEKEKADYEHWKRTHVCHRIIDWLSIQYGIFLALPQDIDEAIDFLDLPSSKGFVIHFHKTQYSRRDVIHLFDFLKEKVQELGYRTQLSDTRTYTRLNWVETVERHHLKPKTGFSGSGKVNQRFGNITIEVLLRNEVVHNLKLRANSYKDHLFQEAKEFSELMQSIF